MDQAQFEQIVYAYVSNPRNRAELNHSHLTVFPGKAPWLRVLPLVLLLTIPILASLVLIYLAWIIWPSLRWPITLFLIALLSYLGFWMFAILRTARSRLIIDLATGEATAKTFRGGKPQLAMNLADGISFAGMSLKDYSLMYRLWFPIHCIVTTVTSGHQRLVLLLPFVTADDYNAFAPVLDALLRRFSRVAAKGAPLATTRQQLTRPR